STENAGGGIKVVGGSVALSNTIVAGNFKYASGTKASDISGRVSFFGSAYNLVGTGGSGGLVNWWNHNQVGVRHPRLGPLAYNGGPTKTVALLPRSPAINAGSVRLAVDPVTKIPLKYDQRGPGFPRVVNGRVDVGAFEVQTPSGLFGRAQ